MVKVIEVTPGQFAVRFKGKAANIKDFSKITNECRTVAERAAKESFQKQADPRTNRPWAARKPESIRRRPGLTLLDTGTLRLNIRTRLLSIYSFALTNIMDYAKVHQFGYKPKNIPARPYAGLSSRHFDKIFAIISKHINKD